ncbi:hypothetical protein Taro_003926 [Colocasia esculenta]|uniref:Uncharacterized protein n=1 Tax=Colocasia esculenta TaxID=4460 RepID=A0A843TN19_COLES|nr:hypothetical protein [Colocasia esculenta]
MIGLIATEVPVATVIPIATAFGVAFLLHSVNGSRPLSTFWSSDACQSGRRCRLTCRVVTAPQMGAFWLRCGRPSRYRWFPPFLSSGGSLAERRRLVRIVGASSWSEEEAAVASIQAVCLPTDVATAERIATSEKASPWSDATLSSWRVGMCPRAGLPLGPSGGNAAGCLPAFNDRMRHLRGRKSGGFCSVCGVPVSRAVPCVPALADGPSGGLQKGYRACLCLLGLSRLQASCVPRTSVSEGVAPGGGRAQVTDLEQKGKTVGTVAEVRHGATVRPVCGVCGCVLGCDSLASLYRGGCRRESVAGMQEGWTVFLIALVYTVVVAWPCLVPWVWLVWPRGPCLVVSAVRVLSGCLVQEPNCCFGNPFIGAVRGDTGVCSSLTSWRVRCVGWFCLWTLDLVEV